jgi:hypothetical protein
MWTPVTPAESSGASVIDSFSVPESAVLSSSLQAVNNSGIINAIVRNTHFFIVTLFLIVQKIQ